MGCLAYRWQEHGFGYPAFQLAAHWIYGFISDIRIIHAPPAQGNYNIRYTWNIRCYSSIYIVSQNCFQHPKSGVSPQYHVDPKLLVVYDPSHMIETTCMVMDIIMKTQITLSTWSTLYPKSRLQRSAMNYVFIWSKRCIVTISLTIQLYRCNNGMPVPCNNGSGDRFWNS